MCKFVSETCFLTKYSEFLEDRGHILFLSHCCPLPCLPPPKLSADTKQLIELTYHGSAHAKNDWEHATDSLVGYGKKKEKENKYLKIRSQAQAVE